MKIIANFDRAITEVLADKVKARLNFKVAQSRTSQWPLGLTCVLCEGSFGYLPLL